MAKFSKKRRLTKEESAARVLQVFTEHLDKLMPIERLCHLANMTICQVRYGERYLKEWLNERSDQLPDWTLHIRLGNNSEHGMIQDSDKSFIDALSRLLYMSRRSESELNYREQQITRVLDDITRKHLKRGITYQRAATESFADAYERLLATG